MEALLFIGMILFTIAVIGLMAIDIKNEKDAKWGVMFVVIGFLAMGFLLFGMQNMTYKTALDNNPYQKEYVYKENSKGEMQVYDSIYVRKK